MDDSTIQYILNNHEVDPVSKTPFSTIVFMLYYGLELENFLMELSDECLEKVDLDKHQIGEYSLYKSGSVAQGFYLNTNYLPDARDIDIVAICDRYDIRERCAYDEDIDEGVKVETAEKVIAGVDNDKENADTCAMFQPCTEGDDRYFNIKVLPDTPPGYVLIERCRRNRPKHETVEERFVSSLKATETRVNFWRDLQQPVNQQRFDGKGGSDDKSQARGQKSTSSLFSSFDIHGPAATAYMSLFHSTTPFETDLVFCVPYPLQWPKSASDFLTRKRPSGWPPKSLIDQIYRDGCTLITKGEIGSRMEDYEWRISFTGELRLARALNRTQRGLIHALKALISEPQHPLEVLEVSTSVESYHLLNLMYRESEIKPPSVWEARNIAKLMFLLLDEYVSHFEVRYLPHYFIGSRNVFAKYKDLTAVESDRVLYTVLRIRRDPVGQIIQQKKYTNLPPNLRRWIFEPISNSLGMHHNGGPVNASCYIQTLIRLVKSHVKEKHYDIACRYAMDASRFLEAMKEEEKTFFDYFEVHLTKAIAMSTCGRLDDAVESLRVIEENIAAEKEDEIENKSRESYYQLRGRVKFIQNLRNKDRSKEGMTATWLSYNSAMSQSVKTEHLCVEYMYFVWLLYGPDVFIQKSVDMKHFIPGAFDDISSSQDVEVLYDRKQFAEPNALPRVEIDVEEYARTHRVQLSSDAFADEDVEEVESTPMELQTPIDHDMQIPIDHFVQTPFQQTEFGGEDHEIQKAITRDDLRGTDADISEHAHGEELQHHDTPIMPDEIQSTDIEDNRNEIETTENPLETEAMDTGTKTVQDVEMLYDRKNGKMSVEKLNEHLIKDSDDDVKLEYTESDVNMIDAMFVEEFCRSKLFEEIGMHEKAQGVLRRIKTEARKARSLGKKVNLEMIEKAYTNFVESAKTAEKMFQKKEDGNLIDNNYIYFSEAEKPFTDEIIQKTMEQLNRRAVSIPIYLLQLHTKILFFNSKNLGFYAQDLLVEMKDVVSHLTDSDDIDVGECMLKLHRRKHSDHFGLLPELNDDEDMDDERVDNIHDDVTVKKQVFKWIETVFETMKKYEPKNKYLDEVFAHA